MNIYIDEAGAFVPPHGRRKFSVVLALVVPVATEAALFYEFLRLRDAWPEKGVEIKGSKLEESQTAEIMNLLAAHGAIAEYQAIDMSLHPDDIVDECKQRLAAALTANLTPAHAGAISRRLKDDGDAIQSLSNPLFVQAFLAIELILELLNVAVNRSCFHNGDGMRRPMLKEEGVKLSLERT